MKIPKTPVTMVALVAILALVLSACTIDQPAVVVDPETVDSEEMGQTAITNAGVVDAENALIVASSLLDYSFENIDGAVSGEIEDLIVDISTGNVLYASLEYGGFLDIGDTELPVPLNAFAWGEDGQLILNIEEAVLQEFPDLGDDWPDLTTAGWDDELVNFWNDEGIGAVQNFDQVSDSVVRISDVIGYGVGDVGLGVGSVDNLLIDLGASQVTYALVGYDATVYGTELFAVPFDALSISTVGNELVLNEQISTDMLENAPRIATDALAGTAPQFYNDANNYWGGVDYGSTQTMDGTTETEASDAESTDAENADTESMSGVSGAEDFLVRASTLLDYNVSNLNGDNIGEIEDMLIDVENGNILFATLEYGGFLDIGDSEVPVPLSALNWVGENELTLNIDEQQLENLPNIDDNWPNVADATWNDEVVNFWNDQGIDPGYGASDSQTIMHMENLIDYGLEAPDIDGQVSIHDMLIDLSKSQAVHIIADYGGFLDNNLVALPFSALDVEIVDEGFRFTPNVTLEQLQNVPMFDQTAFEGNTLFDAGFDDEINTYWQDAGYDVGL